MDNGEKEEDEGVKEEEEEEEEKADRWGGHRGRRGGV